MSVHGHHPLAGFRPCTFISLLLGLVLLAPGSAPRADVSDLAVIEYTFVGQSPAGRTHFDFTYRITIRNDGGALANVRALATSTSPITSVLDGDVAAGTIAAGGVVTPEDTFTFRQNRRFVFDPSSIVWTFTADPVEPANTPPVADAGPDQALQSGTWVQLDGSGSTDADGDPLSYSWQLVELPAGSTAVLDDPAAVMPGFLADRPGDYVGRLVVNDGQVDSAPDFITVSSENTPPVADAGLDQTVPVGGTAQLFGTGSFDANSDPLTYTWRLASRPTESIAELDSTSEEGTSFVVDVAGEYTVELVVNDGYVDSAPDTALVTTSNSPPVADAGDDQEVEAGSLVTLDGSFSFDVDDDPLDYSWSLLSRPPGSAAEVASPPGPIAQFMADIVGLYVAQLIVNDGTVDSAPDTAVITAVAGNQPPLAVAAASPLQPDLGDLVQLDGSSSSDPDGDDLTYLWTLARPAGSSASLSSATNVAPSFVADVAGTYTATLVVNDGEFDSAPAAVAVTVSTDNNPPAVVAVGDRVTFVGATLAFRIFAIDPDAGDTLTFGLPTAPAGASIDLFSGDFVYNAPASPTLETVTVRVTDSGGLSDTASFTIDVRSAPVAPPENAPPALAPIAPRMIQVGHLLAIQTDASDPDAGDTLSYTLPAAPAGMMISSSGLIEWTPVVAQVGAHDVTVQVTDTAGAAALQSTTVTVVAPNRPPVAVDDLYDARIGETKSVAAPGVLDNDRDPDGDALSASLVSTTANGVLDFRPDGSFDYTPGLPQSINPVELELLCESPVSANGFQHNGTVAVGDVDNDGQVEIVGYNTITDSGRPELWILNARDCTPKLGTSPAVVTAGGFSQGSHPGLLDIDGDGDLEIIAPREALPEDQGGFADGRHLLAVHHDGTPAWPGGGASATSAWLGPVTAGTGSGPYRYAGPTFADIDADGVVEIVMPWQIPGSAPGYVYSGVTVYDSRDGSIKWEFAGPDQRDGAEYQPPVIADLDRDGTMEIIVHTQVIDHLGGLEFELPVEGYLGDASPITSHLYTAVADFDGDGQAEIVAYDQQNVYLYAHDGTLLWQRPFANNGQGQVTVADFDGDGEVEFALLAGTGNLPGYLVVFNTDGQVLWSHAADAALAVPAPLRATGPNLTAWDANADGAADLVVHYDTGNAASTGIYIFNGRDGSVLEFVAIDAGPTAQRFVTIVDVNDDGTAELISSYTSGGTGTTRVWRGSDPNPLPPAPSIRNQWIFDQTRIDDVAHVLTDPEPAWLQPQRNGYHLVSDPQRVYTQTKCELPFPPSGFGTNGTMAVGDVDGDGNIELVGITPLSTSLAGDFFVVNAADCSVKLGGTPLTLAAGGLRPGTHVGLLDIDGDGDLELIGRRLRFPGGGFDTGPSLIAVHHDGTLAWPGDGGTEASAVAFSEARHVGPQFADLDGDGAVEILVPWHVNCGGSLLCSGVTVYNSADGSLKWEYQGEPQRGNPRDKPVTIADLNLDGNMEVIVHTHVVNHAGEFLFRLPVTAPSPTQPLWATHLHTAIANFDDDPYPEIIARDTNRTYLFEHDGTLKWEILRDTSSMSPITVADFDGDGQLEYAYLGGDYSIFSGGLPRYLEVYDTDGTPLWSHADRDRFKEPAGSTSPGQAVVAFDANDDGAYDLVVYLRAPGRNGMYIFSGRDGSLLEFIPINYYQNYQRFPVVADIDGDGHAELISSFDGGLTANILVVEGIASKPLPPAPPVRTQWHYHEAYVNDDASIPANPTPHWLRPETNGWHMISRAPDPLAGTTDSFTYQVTDGQSTSNLATVSFDVQPAGTPPAFLSQPDTFATVNFPYEYATRVVDLDPGDSVTLTLATAPPGMTLSSGGLLSWMPDAVGEYPVSLLASDTIGYTTVQSFTLAVGEPVSVPDVVGSPRTAAETTIVGADLRLGRVRDATHPTMPVGMVAAQSPSAGVVARFGAEVDLVVSLGPGPEDIDADGDGFTPNQGDCNDNDPSIYPGAPDVPGDGIDSNCNGIDGDMPVASIVVSPASATVLAGQGVSLTATGVFDDGTAQNVTGVVTWTNGPNFSSSTPGTYTATATRDGVSGSANIAVVARVDADQVPPTASIATPAANSTVTEPVTVTGTATDGNFLRYELAYALAGESRFTPIVVSTTPVTDGALGRFDPTLLINDLYTLRLTVYDRGGNETVDETTVQVDGNLKVGNFTLSFTDLEVPLAGIPITVTRTYDSRDKERGDFGIGWRLDVETLRLRSNRVPGTGWRVDRSGLAFGLIPTDQHRVSLTLPDGRVEAFDLVVSPQVSPLVPFPVSALRASFRARLGTLGQLESLDNNTLTVFEPQPGPVTLTDDLTGNVYDPDRFRYTSPDGTQVIISRSAGIESVRDTNGNTLTITADGITHSSGKSVDFLRDEFGRITSMVDPAGNAQSYVYDGNGDLRAHIDREGHRTRFDYNRNHGLLRVIDPLDRMVARNEYDADGRLVSVTDPDGNVYTFDRDLDARVEQIAKPGGGVQSVVYDAAGNVLSETDADGATTLRTYDAAGNVLTETNPAGGVTGWSYDSRGNIMTITSPSGEVTSYQRDAAGRMLRETLPDGSSSSWDYDARGNLVRETDALGASREYAYDARGNRVAITDENGAVTQFEYDSAGNRTRRVEPNGIETLFTYDANGLLVSRSVRAADGSLGTEMFSRDREGFITSATDPGGATRTYTRDANGNIAQYVDPLGRTVEKSWDAFSRLTATSYADGSGEVLTYGPRGDLTSLTDRAGRLTTYAYDNTGRPLQVVLPDGTPDPSDNPRYAMQYNALGFLESLSLGDFTATLQHDSGGRLVGANSPSTGAFTIAYDANGNIAASTDTFGRSTSIERDAAGRLTAIEFPDGAREQRGYDGAGNLLSLQTADGAVTTYRYDGESRLIEATEPDGTSSSFAYDERGNLIAHTDARGGVTRFTYDAAGRRTAIIRPLGQTASFRHDASGKLIEYTDFSGQTIEYEYNDLGQVIRRELPDGSGVSFTYTPTGKRSTYTDARGVTTYGYDAQDRLAGITYPDGAWIQYEYDALGAIVAIRTPAQTTTYLNDVAGNRVTVTDGDGGEYIYIYDQAGRLISTDRPNGTSESRTYDARDRVVSIENTAAGGAVLSRYDYAYLVDGNIASVTESTGRIVTFEYDANDRLVRETSAGGLSPARTVEYDYDAVGNRVRRIDSTTGVTEYTYDANDRLIEVDEAGQLITYSYDANGNLVAKSTSMGTLLYDWSADGRLIRIRGGAAGDVVYEYDPDGLLLSRQVGGETTRFLTDTQRRVSQVVEEVRGAVRTPLVLAGGKPVARGTGADRVHYLEDGWSGVRQHSDVSGDIDAAFEYDAFGNLTGQVGNPGSSDIRYRSEYFDEYAEAYYLRARFYDPAVGRFLSVDPLEGDPRLPMSFHRYMYANANPVTFIDPLGERTITEVAVSIGVYGTLVAIPTVIAGAVLRSVSGDVVWDGPAGMLTVDTSWLGGRGASAVIGASLYNAEAITCKGQRRDVVWATVLGGFALDIGTGGSFSSGTPIGISAGTATMYSPQFVGAQPWALAGGSIMFAAAAGIGGDSGFGFSASAWFSGLGSNIKSLDGDGAAGTVSGAPLFDVSVSALGGFTLPVYWSGESRACAP